ncbi:hypothetical protein HDV00_009644 [Rhizophlyctis rosea]|nr:hypothetical protein HDV00_009644 [Rhizophlyctis rosea]
MNRGNSYTRLPDPSPSFDQSRDDHDDTPIPSPPTRTSRLKAWTRSHLPFHTSPRRTTQILLITTAIICITALIALQKDNDYDASWPVGNGSVASPEALCSAIGEELLSEGGGAVDAVIGTALCTGVINSYASGIGGGAFLLVRPRGGAEASVMFDCRETAPAAATPDMFNANHSASIYGGLSVGVPGELQCFAAAHKRYGRLAWSRLFKGAITLARDGFPMPKGMANRLHQNRDTILSNPEFKAIYAPSGEVLKEGEICNRRNLAETLDAIAEGGIGVFYNGTVGEKIVDVVRKQGGVMSMDDLRGYKVVTRTPLHGEFFGRRVIVPPAPSAGPIMLSILNILSALPQYNASATDALQVHRLIEAVKFGKAQHTLLGDPLNDPTGIRNATEWIVDLATAKTNAARLTDSTTHPAEWYASSFPPLTDHGTCHISVLSGTSYDYEAASLTTTTNMPFGSWIMEPETGIILNDEMDDFGRPNVTDIVGRATNWVNWPRAGRRPLSSMVPVVVEEGGEGLPVLVVGGSGGGRIPTTLAQILTYILHPSSHFLTSSSPLADVIKHPRFHHGLVPPWLEVEIGMKEGHVTEGLLQRNHTLYWYNGTEPIPSLVQGVFVRGGKRECVADDRIERIGSGQ